MLSGGAEVLEKVNETHLGHTVEVTNDGSAIPAFALQTNKQNQ